MDIIELYSRRQPNNTLAINIEPVAQGLREGDSHNLAEPPKEDYAETLMKQLAHCDGTTVDDEVIHTLREFLASFSIAPPLADKNHFRALMKLLARFDELKIDQKDIYLQLCLTALQRIMFNRSIIEDAHSNKGLDLILKCLFQNNNSGYVQVNKLS